MILYTPETHWSESFGQAERSFQTEEWAENRYNTIKDMSITVVYFSITDESPSEVALQNLTFILRDSQGNVYRKPEIASLKNTEVRRSGAWQVYDTAAFASFDCDIMDLPNGPIEFYILLEGSSGRLSAKWVPRDDMRFTDILEKENEAKNE